MFVNQPSHRDDASPKRQYPLGPKSSIPAGDVVLANLPPYSTQPWLSMGVVLQYMMLANHGIRARVVRPLDPPFQLPPIVEEMSWPTMLLDPSMEQRLERMERVYASVPEVFDRIVDLLLEGGERVVGLSVFRNSVDFTIWTARLIKKRSPDTIVVIGGPEAIEEPEALVLPWVDAVVGADAHAVIVPLMEAALAGRIEKAATLKNVWLNPKYEVDAAPPLLRPAEPVPTFPRIDYTPILPLLLGDAEPTVPMLLNWGCPYNCGFCSNRITYSRFAEGDIQRVIEEMDAVMAQWGELHRGRQTAGIDLQLSDATTNALPRQFDALLERIIERRPSWPIAPRVRGQILMDARVTTKQALLMREAGFSGAFFGLDAGTDGFRRSLKKPGKIADVAAALQRYHEVSAGELNMGIPVGMPGETVENFRATQEFLDWALDLGAIRSLTILPYVYFLQVQDPEYSRINRGERRGLLWRTDGPAGDPAERARRFMSMFEVVRGRVPALSPVPPYLALPVMLPDEDPKRIEEWLSKYGFRFDQITPKTPQFRKVDDIRLVRFPDGREAAPDIVSDERWQKAPRLLAGRTWPKGWVYEGIAWRPAERETLIVSFRNASDELAFATIELADPKRPTFARTPDYNISYLRMFNGAGCAFDEALMKAVVATLREDG